MTIPPAPAPLEPESASDPSIGHRPRTSHEEAREEREREQHEAEARAKPQEHKPGCMCPTCGKQPDPLLFDFRVTEDDSRDLPNLSMSARAKRDPWPRFSDVPQDGKIRQYTRTIRGDSIEDRVEEINEDVEAAVAEARLEAEEHHQRQTQHLERKIQAQRAEIHRLRARAKTNRPESADQLTFLRCLVRTTADIETLRRMALKALGETSK